MIDAIVAKIESQLEGRYPDVSFIASWVISYYGVEALKEFNKLADVLTGDSFWECNFDLLCLILADLGEL